MTTRIIRLAAGLAAVGLLATACGDDGDDAGATTAAPVEAHHDDPPMRR